MKCVKSQRQEGSYSASTDLANQELKLREGYNGIKVPNLKLYWGGGGGGGLFQIKYFLGTFIFSFLNFTIIPKTNSQSKKLVMYDLYFTNAMSLIL